MRPQRPSATLIPALRRRAGLPTSRTPSCPRAAARPSRPAPALPRRQEEAGRLVKDVFRVYFDPAEYKHVELLNARPAAFDWEAFVRAQLARHTPQQPPP